MSLGRCGVRSRREEDERHPGKSEQVGDGQRRAPVDVAIDGVGLALGMLVWLRVRQR